MSSSKKPVSLYLTRLTPALWAQFYHWYDVRGEDHRPIQPPGGCGAWVVREAEGKITINGIDLPEGTPELVAGCCFFPCEGGAPYAVIEFVSTNPHLPARLVHAAVERICVATSQWGAMTGKTPVCFPKHKGVKRLMRKLGYGDVKPEVQVLYSPLFVPVGVVGGEKTELTSPPATMVSAEAAE